MCQKSGAIFARRDENAVLVAETRTGALDPEAHIMVGGSTRDVGDVPVKAAATVVKAVRSRASQTGAGEISKVLEKRHSDDADSEQLKLQW